MAAECALTSVANWQQQTHQYLVAGEYSKAASLYEQAIAAEPAEKSHYWNLGLVLLLQGQELEAQTTWLLSIAEGEPEQVELWTAELVQVLQKEATRQEEQGNFSVAWTLRQHMREISPEDVNNLLHLIELSLELDILTDEQLVSLGIVELLKSGEVLTLDFDLLLRILQTFLKQAFLHPLTWELAHASLVHSQNPTDSLIVILPASIKIAYSLKYPGVAARFLELYLNFDPGNIEVLRHLACFYQNAKDYFKGIDTAKLCNSLLETLPDKIYGEYLVLRGLMSAGGYWQEACEVGQQQKSLMLSLVKEQPIRLGEVIVQRLFTSPYFLPYLKDEPKQNRFIQNQLAQLCQYNVQADAKNQVERFTQRRIGNRTRPLKIGYISYCLRSHSVGWLARWVFKYHNPERFQIYSYLLNYSDKSDLLQEWYLNQGNQIYKGDSDGLKIAEKVYADEIDILIDLDSITLDTTCQVMSLKPAPVQVTWLGWDASGIPAVDYFIADPYVLPESAQDYYVEKIWRLPQTYIAVDGFEVAVPTLRRDQLDLPSDAVVYLCPQRGYKLNSDMARLQLKILKEVPNSYFLIKGLADKDSITTFYTQIAEEEGVARDRLRFLPEVSLEAVHRANLGIVDVVLDTYPYNGATTTLETLWMCIPMVTRVGQQFAARNSYTMMLNAGIKEGIAWTDEEYMEWGIRLGKDSALRQQISWRLRQSRQTSPLWNAKQFTQDMENAYEQMWMQYLEKNKY